MSLFTMFLSKTAKHSTKKNKVSLTILLMMLFSLAGFAQVVSIPNTSAVVENFNAITTAFPAGWVIHNSATPVWSSGATAPTVPGIINTGSPTTGGTYIWGNTAATDISIGAMTSGGFTSPNNVMVKYVNNNATAITQLAVSYSAKKYRTNTALASVQFFYSLNGSTWTAVTAGDIAAATIGTGANAYSFGPPVVYAVSSFNISSLNIVNAANIYLRWNLNTTGGNSQGIGIDDVSVTATVAAAPYVGGGNIVNGGVNFVGRINSYSQPTNCTGNDYRVLNYRKVSTTTANTTDGRGQWFTTVNVQSSGGNVTPDNMPGGGGAGFLLTSGGECGNQGTYANKWNFTGTAQAALDGVNLTTLNSSTDMGINMGTAGRYTFVMKDVYNTNGPAYYVGYTTNAPVAIAHTGAAQQTLGVLSSTITATLNTTPSSQEKFYLRFRATTNDFTSSTSLVLGTVSGTTVSFNLAGLTGGTTYYYYVLSTTSGSYTSLSEVDRTLSILNYADNNGANFSFVSPAATSYIWNNASSGSWATAANWTPNTGVPGSGDNVTFSNNATVTVSNVPTATLTSLTVSGTTAVTLTAATTSNTLTLSNAATALSVGAGSTLAISGIAATNALAINFTGAGNMASIAGTLSVLSPGTSAGSYDATNSTTTVTGTFIRNNAASVITSTSSNLIFASTGTLQMTGTTSAIVPTATWQTGSLLRLSQTGSTGISITGLNGQTFSNLTVDATHTGIINFNNTGTAISFTIAGNYTQSGTPTIDLGTGAGTTNIFIAGAFQKTAGVLTTTVAPNATITLTGTGNANFQANTSVFTIFVIATNAVYTMNGNVALNGASTTLTVNGTLDMGTNLVTGTASSTFSVTSGATLKIGSPAGITTTGATGNVQVGSTRTYSTAANYVYKGVVAQVTGNGLPSTVNTLSINNTTAAVSLSFAGTTAIASTSPASLVLTSGTLTVGTGNTISIADGGGISAAAGDFTTASLGSVVFLGTGTVSGTVNFYPAVLQTPASPKGVTYSSGSTIRTSLELDANSFVNSTPPVYATASNLIYNTGGAYGRGIEWSTTSGAGYPYNVKIQGGTTVDISGGAAARALANDLTLGATGSTGSLTMNNMANKLTVGGSLSVGSNTGTSTLTLSTVSGGDIEVNANWSRNANGAVVFNSRAVSFIGTVATTVTTATTPQFAFLFVNKTGGAGVSIANDIQVNNNLTFTSGNITTAANKVIIAAAATVSRTSGHVAGNMQKNIATGSPTVTYEIGGTTSYRPVVLAFTGVSVAGDVTATVTQAAGAHPQLGTSTLSTVKRLDRYFTLTNSGTTFTSYSPTFNFVAGDVINSADPNNFLVGEYAGGSWTYPTVGSKTLTSTQATGVTGFGDFAMAESGATPIVSATALTGFGNVCVNTVSPDNTFTINGTFLTNANLTVAALPGFTYSLDNITYTNTLSIAQPGGTFSQLVHVKFSPTAVQSYSGDIVVGGGGATSINVAATGSGINTAPTTTTGGASAITAISATVAGNITVTGCSAITAYGIEYSTSNGFANGTGTPAASGNLSGGAFSVNLSGLSAATIYYYKAYATNGGGTSYSAQASFTTATPALSASAITAFGAVCINTVPASNTFTVTGTNLTTANVTLATLNGFTYSTDNITYTGTLSIAQPGGSFSQLVYVKFSPVAVQLYSGNILVGGGGAVSINAAASGSGVNTVPSLTTGSASGTTQVSSTLSGTITANGCSAVTAYGIEYSTSIGFANGTGTPAAGSNLSGGAFSVAISGLSANTTYYYKAYATNAGGTGYGAQQSFTTSILDAPVATAATAIAANSFTANWNAVTGAGSYALDVSTSNTFTAAGTVAAEAFENPLTLFTATGTGAFYTGSSASGERPPSSPFFAAGASGYGVSNGTATLTSGNINTTGGAASLSFKLASFSLSGNANGADGGDIVTVEVSPNGGTSYFSTLRVLGNNNACWAYSATGTASTAYDGNATPVDVAASGGGLLPAGPGTVTITGLPTAANVRIRITLFNDNNNERWVIDDLNVAGTAGSFVSGYNNLSVAGLSQSVTGLTSNTTYYYRVRAVSASSTSANSNTITALTCQAAVLSTTHNNVSCNGGSNGSIDLTVTAGTAPLTYSWTGPGGFTATTQDISGLLPGLYSVTVFSNTGCPATTAVTITEPTALTAAISGNPAAVCSGSSANITVTLNGGTAPFSVVYNDGIGNTTAGGLTSGTNTLSLSPAATTSYTLVSVTDANTCTGSVSGSATITILPNHTITASAGANGSISPNGISTLCEGTNQTYTITPAACYSIANVIVDGVPQGAVGTYTFTNVTADHTINATFVLNTYTITVAAGTGGAITPATGLHNCGDNVTYTITADACHTITDVIVDGVSQAAVGTYTFTNVTANHNISATFTLNTYSITVTAGANGTITPATGSHNCGDNVTYTITPNACYSIADVIVDGVSQGAVGTYTFTNVTANHNISASFTLNTYSITVTAGANGTITPATGTVNCGDNATYTITPNACYSIADVIVDGVSQGAVGTYTFTNVTANHNISASFVLNTYSITVTAGANGTITPATGTVNCGANATYTITPNACYSIADVIVDGVSQGAVGTYTFTNVTANHNISATFTLNTYSITVTAGANGTITPATGSHNCGDNATYTITPNACYSIADVIVDGVSQGAVGTFTFTNVTANHNITASFTLNTYSITVTAGANGTITPATGNVNCGDNATYTITPNACYSIADVIVDGVSQGAVGTYTFTNVTANHNISASFTLNTYTITATAGANGTITPSTGTVNCGDNATYTITPNACYSIADVIVDGVSQGAVGTYTFTNVTANHNISATFTLNTYSITVTSGANGTITPANGSVNCGDNATYTITPNACYSIADVIVDGVSQGAVGTYTFTNVTANHNISATFTLNTYSITVTAGANGTITPATGTVNCGANATYTITPNACYSIADVIVDGVSQGAVGTYTFTNVTANHNISASFTLNTYTITATAGANGTITPATGSVNCGDNPTYTITPNACYSIADVIVDGVSQGAVGTYTFTNVTSNHNISATFTLNTYTITVTAGANGTITPATGTVNCGDNATYTVTANACYSIADVIVDGVSQGAVGTYTFTNVTSTHNISATFTLNTYSITVTSGANGTITPGTGTVNCGANATYTITPNSCYSIADVIVDGVSQGAVGTYTFTNVTANHNISASFTLNTYSITVTAGANGTITPATGNVNCGDNATYTITPNACYSIADVIVDGVSQGAVGTYTFTNVTSTHNISASFTLNTYSITVTSGANGTITPATGSVNCGDNATYTITPNACYSIADVIVDGVSQGAVGTYTFTNVTANHNISASFTLNTYSITVAAGANGTITPATGTVNCGDNATYTITPNACYSIADVIVDGVSQGAVGTFTFTNVTANHNISASFTLNTYTITVTAAANGTITPATGTVTCGANATYTITPNACYSIADVIVDGVSQAAVGTYTFTNVTTNHTISASFISTNYTITVTAGANGTITPATGTITCGGNATYTITPNACYSIANVLVDGISQGAVATYTFTNVTANHTISATFILNTYSITVTAGANGTITPATGSVNCGANATYTITANSCYHINDVLVDGVSQGAIGTYTFTNVTATHTISASFTANAALTAPVVSGIVNVCPYIGTGTQLTYTSQSVPGATSYNWVVPTSVTIVSGQGTASINVTISNGFQANGNKQIRLTVQTTCGVTPQTIYVLVAQSPNTPQPITGSSNVCTVIGTAATITYKIPSVVGATSYVWTAQAGTTTISHPNGAGINDTTVTVSFTNGFTSSNITVAAANGCGTSNARSLALVKSSPSTPGLISGPTNVCENILPAGTAAVYRIISVAGATSYTWTVTPATATVTHPNGPGAADTVINVTFQPGFTTGSISVSATSGCGTSGARTLSLSKLSPATPGVIDVIQTQPCPERLYSYTIAATPANATSLQWVIPTAQGAVLVSQSPAGPLPTSIIVSYPATSVIGIVTVQAFNNCGSSTLRSTPVRLGTCDPERTFAKGNSTFTTAPVANMQVNVFPNPTVSDFKVQVLTADKQTINVRILDATGRSFKQFTVQPYQTTTIGADLKAGAYLVEVRQGSEVKTTKLLKF